MVSAKAGGMVDIVNFLTFTQQFGHLLGDVCRWRLRWHVPRLLGDAVSAPTVAFGRSLTPLGAIAVGTTAPIVLASSSAVVATPVVAATCSAPTVGARRPASIVASRTTAVRSTTTVIATAAIAATAVVTAGPAPTVTVTPVVPPARRTAPVETTVLGPVKLGLPRHRLTENQQTFGLADDRVAVQGVALSEGLADTL